MTIPQIALPLAGLAVLVTRPALQARALIEGIAKVGGEPIAFPTLEIVPVECVAISAAYDLIIFTSSNAVEHGVSVCGSLAASRLAAIGPATAAALSSRNLTPAVVPATLANSESLLAHPDLRIEGVQRVLIVRGAGGRELLRAAFEERAIHVDVIEVYRRTVPHYEPQVIAQLEQRWAEGDVNVVTATSFDALKHLATLLTPNTLALLRRTPIVVASERIRELAQAEHIGREFVVASGADDSSIIGALTQWHARARTRS
jgi:uroporphyrinogen-III synthase